MTSAPQAGREHTDWSGGARYLVNVLGPFDIWRGDRDCTPSRGRPSELVMLLAIHNGRLHREQVIDTLWPTTPLRLGASHLRNLTTRTRKRTGPLVTRNGTLVCLAQPYRIDLSEFLRLSHEAIQVADRDPQEAILRGSEALTLHRGPLMEAYPYLEWAQDVRRHTEHRHRLLLEALAHACEQLGDVWASRLYRERARFLG